ncbi:hypothetical protein [Pseudomonas rhodesiae]|uniref:hypothetical protein n=1 Tax=Pseudomonas rhodesiae TaxID=76760 RepID=UPI0020A0E5CD|nr:hypothetical protein [Pseudomonas rhodesiae]MCP1515248.1 hypothetical protein [Pseudomonas rhodesiae]MDF9768984.1 hypothetical protein [Pseudomonas rhodesiae]
MDINELPDTIGQILRRIGGARTYVLSEMQLSTAQGDEHIQRFYRHDCMYRFSDLIGSKLGFQKTGEYCSGDGSLLFQLSEYCADHAAVN